MDDALPHNPLARKCNVLLRLAGQERDAHGPGHLEVERKGIRVLPSTSQENPHPHPILEVATAVYIHCACTTRAPSFGLHLSVCPNLPQHPNANFISTTQIAMADTLSSNGSETDISPLDSPSPSLPGAFQSPPPRSAQVSPERQPLPPPIPSQRAEIMAESASPIGIANVSFAHRKQHGNSDHIAANTYATL